MQLHDVPVVRFRFGRVEALNLGMRQDEDDHSLVVSQGRKAAQKLLPDFRLLDRAFAVCKVFGVVLRFDLAADDEFQVVGAVENNSLKLMRLLVQGADGCSDLIDAFNHWESSGLKASQAVLGLNKDRVWCAGCKG